MTEEFTPDFFDQASLAWRNNKVKKGSMFYYRCCYVSRKTGKRCPKTIVLRSGLNCGFLEETKVNTSDVFCFRHRKRKGTFDDL